MQKCCLLTAFIIHYTIILTYNCQSQVKSVDELSYDLSASCLINVSTNCSVDELSRFRLGDVFEVHMD